MPNRLRQQVFEFMERFRHPILDHPQTPPLPRLKLRARLIAEEAVETVTAMCMPVTPAGQDDGEHILDWLGDHIMRERREYRPVTWFTVAKAMLDRGINTTAERVLTLAQMVKVADGMADLDYVTEGARLEFGIDGMAIAELVHTANMAKSLAVDGHGKTQKPDGWEPPDVAIGDELLRQGWTDAYAARA